MRIAFCLASGIAFIAAGVPASFAQDSRHVDHGKRAGTGTKAKAPQTHERLDRSKGIFLAVPIGRILVGPGPEVVGGEQVYVRRSTVRDGITIVEVSTTPFTPVLALNQGPGGTPITVRPDQPAGW